MKLSGNQWKKVAHFNDKITAIQAFENKLFVLGNFKICNDSINSNFVIIEEKTVKIFKAYGLKNTVFDQIKKSENLY